MKRASENVSEHLLLGFFLISLYHAGPQLMSMSMQIPT